VRQCPFEINDRVKDSLIEGWVIEALDDQVRIRTTAGGTVWLPASSLRLVAKAIDIEELEEDDPFFWGEDDELDEEDWQGEDEDEHER
jgi:hypothetical protein